MRQIAGHENAGRRGRESLGIDLRPPRARLFDVASALGEKTHVGGLADGQQHGVSRYGEPLAVVKHRGEAALLVPDAQATAEQYPGDAAVLAHDLQRPPPVQALHPLFLAFDDLDRVGGHLLQGFQGDETHPPGPRQPFGGAGGVVGGLADDGARDIVGDVTATDDDHLGPYLTRLAQRGGAQQIDPAEDPGAVLAGQPQGAGALCPHRQDDRGEIAPELGEGNVPANRDAAADLHPQRLDDGDLKAPRGNGAHVAARVGVHRAPLLAGDELPVVFVPGHRDAQPDAGLGGHRFLPPTAALCHGSVPCNCASVTVRKNSRYASRASRQRSWRGHGSSSEHG